MKVETGNCIVNLDWFIDYTVYFESQIDACFLMGTDKSGTVRKYKIFGIKNLEETQFAFNEIRLGLEDDLSYINISLDESHNVNNEETEEI